MEPHAGPERSGEEMALALFSLLEHHRSAIGLSPGLDAPTGAAELLRQLLVEREELVEEVHYLKDTLRWHQFQCDLQVAVSVADRLRVEAEGRPGTLRESHGNLEGQLDQAQCRQQDTDRELESLRPEHREACHRLSALTLEHQQTKAELDTLRHTLRDRERDSLREREKDSQREMEGRDKEERPAGEDTSEDISTMEALDGKKRKDSEREVEGEKKVNSEGEDVITGEDVNTGGQSPEELVKGGENLLKGKGVAVAYLRNLVAGEKGCGLRDPQRIVMMSERSRSLSRLPLPTDSLPAPNGSSQTTTSTTLPLCKKEEPAKGRRILQRQDSWSSFCTNLRMVSVCFCDVMEAPCGTHSCIGVKAAPMAKNIEITNFSSSWEDGLAFCAVYHTYLPTQIPYSSLSTGDKSENLDLAFQMGESVGITATLTVEEMLRSGGPDWQRVLGCVESMFRHFEM